MVLPVTKTKRMRYDGLENQLGQQLNAGVTQISFASSLKDDGGMEIESLAEDEYAALSILDGVFVLQEIVYLIDYVKGSTTGTITRAEEGTDRQGPITHTKGNRVVHAPTANDFAAFDYHLTDPNAHSAAINAAATAAARTEVAIHEDQQQKPNPHPQYALRNNITVNVGETLNVYGVLHIRTGATLLVDGTLNISNIGKLIINGHEIVVSNNPPTSPQANVVWIQTFG